MSLYETMKKCNNFFSRSCESGNFTIENNQIAVQKNYLVGQYIRVVGSILNDGVYKISDIENQKIVLDGVFTNETFNGYIVGLAVPQDFISLCKQIDEFDSKRKIGVVSESIPNYSVSYDTSAKSGFEFYRKELANYNKPISNKFEFLKWLDK